MNVAFDSWIPVINSEGKRKLVSLNSIFSEGNQYVDLTVRPHERISLMRLFLCIAHAALKGPQNYDEWCEAPKRLPEEAVAYLKKWKDNFELFHKTKPWLQIAELKAIEKDSDFIKGKTSPVSLLNLELATGNNSTLNDHEGQNQNRSIECTKIALDLLNFQNFSSGGGSPVAQWKTIRTSQVGNPDAPCLSQSMVHCLLRGKSLSETIHLNLPSFETIKRAYKIQVKEKNKEYQYKEILLGRPVWEFFPDSPENETDKIENATKTYMGRLVPISRWIKIIDTTNQMYCCNGFKYDTYKDGFAAEPTAVIHTKRKKDKNGSEISERKVVRFDPMKAVWRELYSLLTKRSAEGLGGPLAMDNAPDDTEFDFQVCAVARNQASIEIIIDAVFHITPKFHKYYSSYQEEILGSQNVIGAEGIATRLRLAIENYRTMIDSDWLSRVKRTQAKEQFALRTRLAESALLTYWTTIEKNLPMLMAHIEAIGSNEAEPTRNIWRKMLFATACDTYKSICSQKTPRQKKAFIKGWQKLTGLPNITEAQNNNKMEVKQ